MPYTYLIGWSNINKWYYGARYAKNSETSDLWKTYFTSSKYVKEFRKLHGEPDIIQVRRLFESKTDCRLWEYKVLKRLNVINKEEWLNKHDGGAGFINVGGYKLDPRSPEHCQKISESKIGSVPWNKGKKDWLTYTPEIKEKISKALRGKKRQPFSEEHRKNISKSNSGKKRSEEWKQNRSDQYTGEGNPRYGKTLTKEQKEKIQKSQKGRPFYINGKRYLYLSEAQEEYGLKSKGGVMFRLESRSPKYTEWFYEDIGRQDPIIKVIKRPDLALMNQSSESRERSRQTMLRKHQKEVKSSNVDE